MSYLSCYFLVFSWLRRLDQISAKNDDEANESREIIIESNNSSFAAVLMWVKAEEECLKLEIEVQSLHPARFSIKKHWIIKITIGWYVKSKI